MSKKRNDKVRQLVKYLSLIQLSTLGMVSSDIYLSLLPAMAHDLGSNINAMQFSISIYILIIGISQFFVGYGLDRYGIKRILILSAPLYVLGCVICYLSESSQSFYWGRSLQALGAAAPLVAWQPLTIELFGEKQGRSVGTYLFIIMFLSLGVAPFFGAIVAQHYGWRLNFIIIAVNAVICIVSLIFSLPSVTLKNTGIPQQILFKDMFLLFGNSRFLLHLIIISINYSCYISFIIIYPTITVPEFGSIHASMGFLPIAVSFLFGALLSKNLMSRLMNRSAVKVGVFFFALSALFLIADLLYENNNAMLTILLPFCVFLFGSGVFLPAATYEAINAGGVMQNSAAALIVGARMCIAFLISGLLTFIPSSNQTVALVAIVCIASVISISLLWRACD
ncbi:MAG: MFS transporter [Burkholderiaceae bacterium]|nr:MFS transporter [Burkholderiaceae bacterium]